jgi:hypothetical protein
MYTYTHLYSNYNLFDYKLSMSCTVHTKDSWQCVVTCADALALALALALGLWLWGSGSGALALGLWQTGIVSVPVGEDIRISSRQRERILQGGYQRVYRVCYERKNLIDQLSI